MIIKLLGTGCKNCKHLETNTQKAISELNLKIDIIKITEFSDISKFNIIKMPGLDRRVHIWTRR